MSEVNYVQTHGNNLKIHQAQAQDIILKDLFEKKNINLTAFFKAKVKIYCLFYFLISESDVVKFDYSNYKYIYNYLNNNYEFQKYLSP